MLKKAAHSFRRVLLLLFRVRSCASLEGFLYREQSFLYKNKKTPVHVRAGTPHLHSHRFNEKSPPVLETIFILMVQSAIGS